MDNKNLFADLRYLKFKKFIMQTKETNKNLHKSTINVCNCRSFMQKKCTFLLQMFVIVVNLYKENKKNSKFAIRELQIKTFII